jgi:drug/metabolite transporter (DMT)-like permease
MKGKIFVYLGCLGAMLFWSLSFIWYKDAYIYFTPFTTVFLRLVISSVFLFTIIYLLKQHQPIKKADYKYLLLLACFEPLLYFIGESLGLQWVSPTTAAVIISVIPLLVPVLAYFLLKERLLIKNIVGIFISCTGVIMVVVNNNFEFIVSLKGLLCLSLSVFSAVFYSVLLKKLADVYNALTLIAWQNTIGAFMFLPLMLIFEPHGINHSNMAFPKLLPILKLAIFASSGAFVLYAYSVKMLGAVKANIFTNLIPVLTAFLSFVLLDEKLLFHNIIGIGVVIVGLVLSQIDHSKIYRKAIKYTRG